MSTMVDVLERLTALERSAQDERKERMRIEKLSSVFAPLHGVGRATRAHSGCDGSERYTGRKDR